MKVTNLYKLVAMLLLSVLSASFVACSSDDDEAIGSGSALIGKWARQVQWAETNGLRESSYTFEKNGKAKKTDWDWGDQKYVTETYTWEADSFNLWLTPAGGGSKKHYLYEISGNELSLYFESGNLIYTYTKQ